MAAGGGAALFEQGVRAVLGGWAALQVAVAHGFGGPHGPEKVTWLGGALQDFFRCNEGLEQGEVEQFLAEALDQEFDTAVEDGSLEQVSRQLLELHARASRGDAAAVGAAVAALARGGPALQAVVATARRGGAPGGAGDPPGSDSDDGDTDDDAATSATSATSATGASQPPPEGRGDAAEQPRWRRSVAIATAAPLSHWPVASRGGPAGRSPAPIGSFSRPAVGGARRARERPDHGGGGGGGAGSGGAGEAAGRPGAAPGGRRRPRAGPGRAPGGCPPQAEAAPGPAAGAAPPAGGAAGPRPPPGPPGPAGGGGGGAGALAGAEGGLRGGHGGAGGGRAPRPGPAGEGPAPAAAPPARPGAPPARGSQEAEPGEGDVTARPGGVTAPGAAEPGGGGAEGGGSVPPAPGPGGGLGAAPPPPGGAAGAELELGPPPGLPDPPPALRLRGGRDGELSVVGTPPPLPPPLGPGLLELQERLWERLPLWAEVWGLQRRFALDWEPERGRVRLLGGPGGAVWTLLLDAGYPRGGGVRLLAPPGTEPPAPPSAAPSLSQWVELLAGTPP